MSAKGLSKQVRHALEAVDSSDEPLEMLAAVRELCEAAEALEISAVASVREDGATWTQIGQVYGTSKQAVQQRFRAALTKRAR